MDTKYKKLRIGVVGCGRISQRHFEAIEKHKDALELVSICDSDQNVINSMGEEFNSVKKYTNLEHMLKSSLDLDLISICTPSGIHSEQVKICSSYNVNVITEKPMSTRWQDALDMVASCDLNNVDLHVVKQNRFNATIQLLKRAVDEKRFGKIHLVSINVFWTRPQAYYDQAEWRGTWEFDGGAFMNHASHYVDLLTWLFGPVKEVQSITSTYRDIQVEDTGVLNILWRNGAVGSMAVSMLTYPKNLEGSITIIGDKGTAKIGGVAVNKILEWNFEDSMDYDKDIESASYDTTSVYGKGHIAYYANLIEYYKNNRGSIISGREGLKSLEVLIAIYLSARDRKTVSLPLSF